MSSKWPVSSGVKGNSIDCVGPCSSTERVPITKVSMADGESLSARRAAAR